MILIIYWKIDNISYYWKNILFKNTKNLNSLASIFFISYQKYFNIILIFIHNLAEGFMEL
jgi:hypothetical protein